MQLHTILKDKYPEKKHNTMANIIPLFPSTNIRHFERYKLNDGYGIIVISIGIQTQCRPSG